MIRITFSFLITLLSFANIYCQQKNQEKMKQALIIVDVQNDYFPGGRMELSGSEAAADNVKTILEYCRKSKIEVIHIQHIATSPNSTFFLPETDGAKINAKVAPISNEKIITKHYPNSFRETNLLAYLHEKKITDLIVTGMMTHVCIDATVKTAKDYGFDCTVISDACATKDLDVQGNKVAAKEVQNALLGAMAFYYAELKTTADFIAH
ncbi:Nicotinamidase-related amidase [Flavobacterium nitrogenifigens]|uniref:Nicotinamidase-related amidase n=2 Tax=Flavobacterium nitrogenifigens TaxID=1617283 RepID=A0A521DW08_9FLAO|nr:Nicotinamidase-related amidase [Flavobacterium nitrogenifigens]